MTTQTIIKVTVISTLCCAVAMCDCLHASLTTRTRQHTQVSFCSQLFSAESLRTTIITITRFYKTVTAQTFTTVKV